MHGFIVTGTDTDVGKTVVSAMLTLALAGDYFKPVQCGLADGSDRQAVLTMTGLPDERTLPEAYRLREPLSPHRAAEIDGVILDTERLVPPSTPRLLIVEGAGGLMVPITRDVLQIDLFKMWALPVILCARTGLGTINHSLLSLAALEDRGIPLQGIIFIGEENTDTERTIIEYTGVRRLGRLPWLATLARASLTDAFDLNFVRQDFEAPA